FLSLLHCTSIFTLFPYTTLFRSYVYIIECKDGTYYVGISNDVFRRFEQHESGKNPDSYTYRRRPLKLVFYASFTDISLAIEKERSEEHTSELQSRENLVCRLLLE